MLPLADNLPRKGFTPVTWGLVAVNVVVFLLLASLGPREIERAFAEFGVVPARFHAAWPWSRGPLGIAALPLLTSLFLHAGWVHAFGNLWMLAILGRGVERRMGSARFLVFYLLTGALSGAAHVWSSPGSTVPAVGASGAIAGVMGAYVALFPRAKLVLLVPIFVFPLLVPVSAVVGILVWFYVQLFNGALALADPVAGGGVAWWAHVGGFVAGLLLVVFFTPPSRRKPRVAYEVWDPGRRRWRSIDL